MYSDMMDEKPSAKNRMLKGIRRQVTNTNADRFEIYEEEDIESDDGDIDMRQKLNRKSQRSSGGDARSRISGSGISDRFKRVRNQSLNDYYEDSGDSLERDNGEDLGEMPSSMKIQVTQSDHEPENDEVPDKERYPKYLGHFHFLALSVKQYIFFPFLAIIVRKNLNA